MKKCYHIRQVISFDNRKTWHTITTLSKSRYLDLKLVPDIVVPYKDFDDAFGAVEFNQLLNSWTTKTLFTKKAVVHIRLVDKDVKITRKNFVPFYTKYEYVEYEPTSMRDVINNFSIEDYLNYVEDRSLYTFRRYEV